MCRFVGWNNFLSIGTSVSNRSVETRFVARRGALLSCESWMIRHSGVSSSITMGALGLHPVCVDALVLEAIVEVNVAIVRLVLVVNSTFSADYIPS